MVGEKQCRRGEVWYFTMVNNYGHELLTGRPCVVLSDSLESDPMVTVMFLTTTLKAFGEGIELKTPRKKSYALISQIHSYDKDRLREVLCTLTDKEMSEIEEAVANRLGLNLDKKVEDDTDKDRIAELEDQIVKQKVTIKAVEKLYEKALELYCELKLQADMTSRVEPKVEPKPVIDEPVDITALKEKFKVYDERQRQKPESPSPREIKPRFGGKVNVNTATAKEIAEFTGMNLTVAYSICGTRKRENIRFEKLEDLLVCKRFEKSHLEKYRDVLEV